jgi:hypothetical protein
MIFPDQCNTIDLTVVLQRLGGSIDGGFRVDKQQVRQAYALLLRHVRFILTLIISALFESLLTPFTYKISVLHKLWTL